MGSVVVFLQQSGDSLAKPAQVAIGVAKSLQEKWGKEKLIGVCLGVSSSAAADDALEYGLDEVWFSEHPGYEKYMAPAYAEALVAIVKDRGADAVTGIASSTGKDLFPRVAAMLEAGQASDIVGVNDDGTLRRPMYAGDALADVEILTDMKVVTARASAFEPATKSGKRGSKSEVTVAPSVGELGEVVSYELSASERPELGDATIVVSGGVSLKSTDNFEKLIFPLADALGAAVGASRAAVDAGYVPNDWQVGQTGKIVAPSLYVACGISGAIQHLAGMKDSKCIVAINKDAEAPIFEVADYGVVGDIFEIIPQLTEEIRRAKSA